MIRLKEMFQLKEAVEDASTSVSKYLPKESFEKFQVELTKIIGSLKQEIGGKLMGRTVTFRGAKGFGQIEQDHSVIVNDVDIVLYDNKYNLLLKGTEGKSRKVSEYYIDPTSPVYMKISRGTPTQDLQQEPPAAEAPKSPIRKVITPTNIPGGNPTANAKTPAIRQAPPHR
jgi:hypothetical protein